MSTHNICFRGEIRRILCGYPLLSVAMSMVIFMPRLLKAFCHDVKSIRAYAMFITRV